MTFPLDDVARLARSGPLLVALSLAFLAAPARGDVTGQQVRRAIRKGVAALYAWQKADGTWTHRYYAGGETCLATLALLHAGESAESDAVARALAHIRGLADQHVYVVSLKIMVLAHADAERYQPELRQAARWLVEAQNSAGLWSYVADERRFDHSNSQFALLGLHAAAQAGVSIPTRVWRNALGALTKSQKEDGGWTYQSRGPSYGSMTAAGVCDLLIIGSRIDGARRRSSRSAAVPKCGPYSTNRALAGGVSWLGRHFRADGNPRRGDAHTHYWLYAIERCGILSGQRYFGEHDWYRTGAEFLVRTQRANGTWNDSVVDTSFAILFLAKGHKALLVQKLQWSQDDQWRPVRQGLEQLIAFIGEKLGQPVDWQVVRFDAPLEDWLAAPLLYMQGRTFPQWNDAQRAKVRAFIEHGGTLLVDASAGSDALRHGFELFAAETFPEFPLRELGDEHAVYHVYYDCPPFGLMGLDVGCRTSVIFSPSDLACPWELADFPRLSEQAFQLGTNIAAYATGRRPLIDRLDVVVLPASDASEPGPPRRDALRFGQIIYEGDWRPFPGALLHLANFLRTEAHIDVITRYRQVRLTAPDLYTCPILYMAGHYTFELSEDEGTALAAHLRRGGFLLMDNCCGPEPFDSAFRQRLPHLFPEATLEPLPSDHPIFGGRPGFEVTKVRYGPDVARERPTLNRPELWGLELDGRLALVYSPFALGCGLEGQEFDGCWGLAAEDARRLAANIILYALTH